MNYFGSVRFFKNMILFAVILMIAIPTGTSIHLSKELRSTRASLSAQAEAYDVLLQKQASSQELPLPIAAVHQEISPSVEETAFSTESPYAALYPDFYAPQPFSADLRESGVIYLTFDDGPSARTGEILDILQEKDIKATFFVIGSADEASKLLLQRIVNEGHTLAMHSYSHNYSEIYASVEAYLADMYQIFTQIKDTTGVTPSLFRFPGGSINGYNAGLYQDLLAEMLRRGFVPYDWNISSLDAASSKPIPADTLATNVVTAAKNVHRGIVLLHDSAPKTTTVQALAPIIDNLQQQGFQLKALTPDVMPVLYAYRD